MRVFEPIPQETETLATAVIDAAFKVHSTLGPGLLESIYERCLCRELELRGVAFKTQVPYPIVYEGVRLDSGLRLDILVASLLVVEIKAVERMSPVFDAQVLTYLKITGLRLGLLLNFNVRLIKDGIRRIAR